MQADQWLSLKMIGRELGRSPNTIGNWRDKFTGWTRPRTDAQGHYIYSLARMREIAGLMDVRPRLSKREIEAELTRRHGDGEPEQLEPPPPDPVLAALDAIREQLAAIHELLERVLAAG